MKEGQVSLFFYLEEGGKSVDRIDVVLKIFIASFGGFCGYFLGG
ncbi:holin, partial [Bacillus thuringiensis]|nr:holin [Bacillus thuringiensis]